VVGRSRSEDDPDGEDVVDLWHEIRWPAVQDAGIAEGAGAQDRVSVED